MADALDPLFLDFQVALAGRYSIDRELGRGGMGVVYLAKEVHLDRLVAIKLLPPERAAEPALRERFLREARLATKLSHPNIIPIHAVDETDVALPRENDSMRLSAGGSNLRPCNSNLMTRGWRCSRIPASRQDLDRSMATRISNLRTGRGRWVIA